MSIPSYAAKIKSSGVYRFVFDKSVVPVTERKTLRLVIGYSEKGPFNTPVYIEERADFIRQFGNISRRMERKGIFFHRLALQALEAGPILVLNLKPFNAGSEPEKTEIYAFNASDLISGTNTKKGSVLVAPNGTTRGLSLSTVYDTNRFWHIDPQRLHEMHGAKLEENTNDYIRILQTSSKEDSCTVFIRPFKPTNYDIKISDWYAGTGSEMPVYMQAIQDHLLSEYFAEIFVFRGEFNKELFKHTGTLGNHRNFKFKYTTYVTRAIKHDGTAVDLTKSEEVALGKRPSVYYTLEDGEVYKNVVTTTKNPEDASDEDRTGTVIKWSRVEKTIDPQYRTTPGLYVQLTAIDTPNGSIYGDALIGFVEKQFELAEADRPDALTPEHERILAWQPFCIYDDKDVLRANPDFTDTYGNRADALEYMSDASTSGFVGNYNGVMFPGFRDATGPFLSLDTRFNADFKEHKMLMQFNELLLEKTLDMDLDENMDYAEETAFHIKTKIRGSHGPGETVNHMFSPAMAINALCSPSITITHNPDYRAGGITLPEGLFIMGKDVLDAYKGWYKSQNPDAEQSVIDALTIGEADAKTLATLTMGVIKEYRSVGHYEFVEESIKSKIMPVLTKAQKLELQGYEEGYKGKSASNYGEAFANGAVPGIYIKGYDYKSIKRSDSGKDLVDKIMAVLGYKGIREALTNNVDVDYHYIIDTFQGFPGMNMKVDFFEIAKAKDNALALVNFPSIDAIMRHVGYTGHRGGFDMKSINGPLSGISLPSDSQGASFGAFYTQLIFTDGSQKFAIPSAGLVSNLFMEKWKTRQPYYIVAGPNHGRIDTLGLVSPDYSYSRPDLDVLEPMGVNAIIHMPRRGIVINSNQTAKQIPVSALSKVHVRELIIFLQNEIEDMLRGYQWELNTSSLRETIRAKADVILGVIQANGGIYDFRTQCDDKNNTPEVIDNEMIILDIDIEPARGAGKMIQTLTIHRTGGIKSSSK